MANTRNVTDGGLVAIAARCPHLRAVDISHSRATDSTLHALAQFCPNLRKLDITYCGDLTDSGLIAVANSSNGLRELKFKGARQLTPLSIAAVAQKCPALFELKMDPPLLSFSIPEPARRGCRAARGLCNGWFAGTIEACMPGC